MRVYAALTLISVFNGTQYLASLASNLYYKDHFELDEALGQVLGSITEIIWIFKPVIGWVVETYDICGSHTKAYLMLSGLMISVMWFLIGTVATSLGAVVACKFTICLASNFATVVGEGVMVKFTKEARHDEGKLKVEAEKR